MPHIGGSLLVALLFFVNASLSPFYPLVLRDVGYSVMAVGWVISGTRLCALIGNPLLCSLADYCGRQHYRPILACLSVLAAFILGLFGMMASDGRNLPFSTVTAGTEMLPLSDAQPIAVSAVPLILLSFYAVLTSPKSALVDTIILSEGSSSSPRGSSEGEWPYRPSRGKAPSYPMQRLWGSVSWGVTSVVVGLVLRHWGATSSSISTTTDSQKWAPSSIIFVIHCSSLILFAMALLSSSGSIRRIQCTQLLHKLRASVKLAMLSQYIGSAKSAILSSCTQYKSIYRRPEISIPIVCGAGVIGLSEAIVGNVYFVYLNDTHQADPLLFSYILCINSMSEVVGFVLANKLLSSDQWLAHLSAPLSTIGAAALATKLLVYASVQNPWDALWAEPLHGIYFSFFWTSMVAHIGGAMGSTAQVHPAAPSSGVNVTSPMSGGEDDSSKEAQCMRSVSDGLMVRAAVNEGDSGANPSITYTEVGVPVPDDKTDATLLAATSAPSAAAMATLWVWYGSVPAVVGGVTSSLLVREAGPIGAILIAAGMAGIGGLTLWACSIAALLKKHS